MGSPRYRLISSTRPVAAPLEGDDLLFLIGQLVQALRHSDNPLSREQLPHLGEIIRHSDGTPLDDAELEQIREVAHLLTDMCDDIELTRASEALDAAVAELLAAHPGATSLDRRLAARTVAFRRPEAEIMLLEKYDQGDPKCLVRHAEHWCYLGSKPASLEDLQHFAAMLSETDQFVVA